MTNLAKFIKAKRKEFGPTQVDLSQKSGVGLRFAREMEQGKKSIANLFKKFERAYPKWIEMIAQSFLPEEQQELYRGQIERMSAKLGIVNCGRCVILSTPHACVRS